MTLITKSATYDDIAAEVAAELRHRTHTISGTEVPILFRRFLGIPDVALEDRPEGSWHSSAPSAALMEWLEDNIRGCYVIMPAKRWKLSLTLGMEWEESHRGMHPMIAIDSDKNAALFKLAWCCA